MKPALGRAQRVVLPEAGLAHAHEACSAQVGEVPRDGRLRGPQHRDEVSNADLPVVLEQVEDAQPRAVRKRTEHLIDRAALHSAIVRPQNGRDSNATSTLGPWSLGLGRKLSV